MSVATVLETQISLVVNRKNQRKYVRFIKSGIPVSFIISNSKLQSP